MIFFKKLMAKYGVIFFCSFLGGFILLITIIGRSDNPILFPLDVRIVSDRFIIYLPFGSALALAGIATVGFEIYKYFKR